MASSIVLWNAPVSRFGQRVRIVLHEKKVPYDTRPVDLANKDEEFKEKYASIHPDPAEPAKVPIMDDTDGTALIESLAIASYLERKYPEPALVPKDPAAAAKVDMFIQLGDIMPWTFACIAADTKEGVDKAKAGLVQGLKNTETLLNRLGNTDGGNYFLGGEYTMADVAHSTPYYRTIVLLKPARGIDVHALIKELGLTRTAAWLEAVLSRPSFVETAPSYDCVMDGFGPFVAPMKD